jgi:predicted metal-dependent phosphoesterase TrpH
MIPPIIVQEAVSSGIHILAVTDHNHTANIEAVQKAARGYDLAILAGMELQTAEDIHLLCIFDSVEQARTLQKTVDEELPEILNNPDYFGAQFIVDETGDFIRSEERLLLNSTSLTLKSAIDHVHALHGLAIPAHVDRQAYGLLPVLGIFPPDLTYDAIEVYKHSDPSNVTCLSSYPTGIPVIQNGDAHFSNDLLGACYFIIENPTTEEFRKAFRGEDGRSVSLYRGIDNPRRGS